MCATRNVPGKMWLILRVFWGHFLNVLRPRCVCVCVYAHSLLHYPHLPFLALALIHRFEYAYTIHPNCDTRRELVNKSFPIHMYTRSKCVLPAGAGRLQMHHHQSRLLWPVHNWIGAAANVIMAPARCMNEVNELWLNGFCALSVHSVHLIFCCSFARRMGPSSTCIWMCAPDVVLNVRHDK